MRVSSIRWGVIWIGIGLFFLAINLELLDSLVFPRLFSLWPVLLIAIGVELMFRRTRFYFLALLSPLLIAAAFMAAATARGDWGWKADEFWSHWAWSAGDKKVVVTEIPADSTVRALVLDLECGPSRVLLSPSDNYIFRATTEYYKRSPWIEHTLTNGVERIQFTSREKTRLTVFGLNISASENEFQIADYLPLKLSVTATDEAPDFDLAPFRLSDFGLDIHANKVSMILGNRSDTVNVSVSGRAGEFIIVIPEEFGVAVTGDSARLYNLLGDSGMQSDSAGYHTDNYPGALKLVRVTLDASARTLSLVRN